jgi:hypothetical protein
VERGERVVCSSDKQEGNGAREWSQFTCKIGKIPCSFYLNDQGTTKKAMANVHPKYKKYEYKILENRKNAYFCSHI